MRLWVCARPFSPRTPICRYSGRGFWGVFLCVRLTLILAAAQPAPGAARRALRRLADHRLPGDWCLHAPDRPGFGSQCADCGGPGPHRPADHRRHPASVLVLGRPPRAVLRQTQDHRSKRPSGLHPVKPWVLWRLVYLVLVVAGCDCSWRWRSGAQAASCSAGVRMPMAGCGRMVPVPVHPLGGGEHGRRRCPPRVPGCGSARPCTRS